MAKSGGFHRRCQVRAAHARVEELEKDIITYNNSAEALLNASCVEPACEDDSPVDLAVLAAGLLLHGRARELANELAIAKENLIKLHSLPRKRRRRSYSASDGSNDPLQSCWHRDYLDDSRAKLEYRAITGHFAKLFRRQFRMPWIVFIHILDQLREDFPPSQDLFGRPSSPLGLLLLGSLSILGETSSFVALRSSTNISEQTHRNFFKKFVKWGAVKLFPVHVKVPQSLDDFKRCMDSYTLLGFPRNTLLSGCNSRRAAYVYG